MLRPRFDPYRGEYCPENRPEVGALFKLNLSVMHNRVWKLELFPLNFAEEKRSAAVKLDGKVERRSPSAGLNTSGSCKARRKKRKGGRPPKSKNPAENLVENNERSLYNNCVV